MTVLSLRPEPGAAPLLIHFLDFFVLVHSKACVSLQRSLARLPLSAAWSPKASSPDKPGVEARANAVQALQRARPL